LVRDPGDPEFTNYKAQYLLHCVAVYVGVRERRQARRALVEALASRIGDATLRKEKRAALIQEIQFVGAWGAVDALGALLADADLCDPATRALLTARRGSARLIRDALAGAKGKCRLTLAQALGVLRDVESLGALKAAMGEDDQAVRMAATWAVANIGDASAVESVMAAADKSEGWERSQATKACLLLAEKLLAAEKKDEARRIYAHLRETRKDGEAYVRDAADKAMKAAGI
ncbi:MAG: HEAT repeat domain-containing protein, partial [Planctomycetes bacterium]|nr:HEAT repeat domain-containing protein [Planctomycetota bacterium]